MSNLYVVDHPLVQYKVAKLRRTDTNNKEFRELVSEIASLICYEATKNLPTVDCMVQTPLGTAKGKELSKDIDIVSILRAGNGMLDAMLNLIPNARVGYIGLYRDPNTLQPVEYYCKLPVNAENSDILLIDPMLATGGTAVAAINFMKERNIKSIKLLCLISAPEGVKNVQVNHPDVDIYTAALDEGLDENGYIVPGLGDAGDRLYGTK